MSKMTGLSFWLMPKASQAAYYQDLCSTLSRQMSACHLPPHVTLYVGTLAEKEDALDMMASVVTDQRALTLKPARFEYHRVFSKSFYLSFEKTPEMEKLTEAFRQISLSPSDYLLDPHLSVFYKAEALRKKAALCDQLQVPTTPVTFDRVRAVRHPQSITSPKDIAAFETIGETALNPAI